MRSVTILSGIAILTLASAVARAETNAPPPKPDPAASQPAHDDVSADAAASGDTAAASSADRNGKAGYNAKKADDQAKPADQPKKNKWPGYYQSSTIDREDSKPYGPPR